MKKKLSIVILGILILFPVLTSVGGCAMGNTSIAQEDSSTLDKKIIKGKTTKAQLQTLFGEPTEKGTQNGREYWMYRTAKYSAGFFFMGMGNVASKDVTINFDKAGIVVSYDMVQSKS